MKKVIALVLLVLSASSCSPIKSSPYGGGMQLELTLHEVKTNLEDLRHEMNSSKAEMMIFDARIKHYEGILAQIKSIDLQEEKRKLDKVSHSLANLEKIAFATEKAKTSEFEEIKHLSHHAKEMTIALSQCKSRIEELEKELIAGQKKFEEVARLKGNIDSLVKTFRGADFKSYKVKNGDSLEKIAKSNRTTVEKIKKLNQMDQDLIVVGQELQIPNE
jgi:hypothetical protein